jgi:hypothetical protein
MNFIIWHCYCSIELVANKSVWSTEAKYALLLLVFYCVRYTRVVVVVWLRVKDSRAIPLIPRRCIPRVQRYWTTNISASLGSGFAGHPRQRWNYAVHILFCWRSNNGMPAIVEIGCRPDASCCLTHRCLCGSVPAPTSQPRYGPARSWGSSCVGSACW